MYKINITIFNNHGELVERQFAFSMLDEMRNLDLNKCVDDAEVYAKENNMYLEELFDSKDDAEFSREDLI